MSRTELSAKVKELKELRAMLDELKGEIETIEDEIKAEMMAQDVSELNVDAYRVRWTTVKSSRFDSSSFKKEMPELYLAYTKLTETKRFTIA